MVLGRLLTLYWTKKSTIKDDNILICEMLDCQLVEVDVVLSNGKILEPIMVSDNLNLYHRFKEGKATGAFLNPTGS